MNIARLLSRNAEYRPDHLAVVFGEEKLTYSEYNKEVCKLANALVNYGIKKGDKVVTFLPNSMELMEIFWAVAKIGAVAVPLSPLVRGSGLVNLINNSEAVLAITTKSNVSFIEEIVDELTFIKTQSIWLIDGETSEYTSYHEAKKQELPEEPKSIRIAGDDPFNIMYSSGTTGLPKGIVHTHFVRSMYGSLFSNYFRITPESVILHTGALVFNGAFLTFMPSMFSGCTYILHDHFDPKLLVKEIIESKVTHIVMVPSQIIAVLKEPDFKKENLGSLELMLSVGAPLHVDYKKDLNSKAQGVFYELYGLTEGFVTILDKNDAASKTGSVGAPPQFFDMKIVDEEGNELPTGQPGEIIGRSPILMSEYYKAPEKTKEALRDGWLYTGDIGYLDEDGYLFLVDRKKDLIISGGVNVYPNDIEEIAMTHPAIREVAVFGVPHQDWGETPVASVMLNEGEEVTGDEIKEWINDRVEARYQKLADVVIMAAFPRNVAGKTLKREIKENYLKSNP